MYKLEDIIQDLKNDTPEVSVLEVIECLEQAQDTISDLQAKVEKLTAALELAGLNFNRSTKYGKGWHDALAYVNQEALSQEGE